MNDEIDRIYAWRHRLPFWNEDNPQLVASRIGYYALQWSRSHRDYENASSDNTRSELLRALRDLGVTTWWSLRQLSGNSEEPEHVAISASVDPSHPSEAWQTSADPFSEFEKVVLNRLIGVLNVLANPDLPTSTTEKATHNLRHVTVEIEAMLKSLDAPPVS